MADIKKYDCYTCTVKKFKNLNIKNIKIVDFIDRKTVYAAVKDEDGNTCLVRHEIDKPLTVKQMLFLPSWSPLLAVFNVKAEALSKRQREKAFRLFYSAIERNRSIFFRGRGGMPLCAFALSDAAAVYAEKACREAVQSLRG